METGLFVLYPKAMLNAGVFDDFKGATTLLLWGDRDGMVTLFSGLSALSDGTRDELAIGGPRDSLIVRTSSNGEASTLRLNEDGLHWGCSPDVVELARDLVEPLLHNAGHQFLDVTGSAEQVIIARDEYPDDLR